jgi:hypothetical protein
MDSIWCRVTTSIWTGFGAGSPHELARLVQFTSLLLAGMTGYRIKQLAKPSYQLRVFDLDKVGD